ncbi:hypothetical protein GCM10010399_07940 [Dactylosporangium fulvum]
MAGAQAQLVPRHGADATRIVGRADVADSPASEPPQGEDRSGVEEGTAAHELSESRHARGKIVLTP